MQHRYLLVLAILLFSFCSCKEYSGETSENRHDSIWNARAERINRYKWSVDSMNKELNWVKTNYGLWRSNRGDVGLKTQEGNEQGIIIEKYITTLCCDGKSLKSAIDTNSFMFLGSSFYKDKNAIYTHYVMSDGGTFFRVENADVATFRIFGDCYAKDKNSIYGERALQMDSVDYATFKTAKGCGCYAKDKNSYYFWDSKMELEDILRPGGSEAPKIIEALNSL